MQTGRRDRLTWERVDEQGPVQTTRPVQRVGSLYLASDHNGLLFKAMEGLTERISAARKRVHELLREGARHLVESSELEEQLRDRHREADVLKARITELEQENEVLRAVKATPAVEDRTGTKEKIDELVNEIDRCLALLNP